MSLTPLSTAVSSPSATESPGGGWPLLRLGFRPFYLGAAAFGALSVPFWLLMWYGAITHPPALAPLLWHAHEILYGFAVAVVVGFLLTAGKAWTGLPTPRGAWLGALALLWLAARIAALGAPYPLYAALDVALLPLVAGVLLNVLLRAKNRRNLPLVGILVLLALANLAFHLNVLGLIDWPALHAMHAALALIVMIECVMGGRVIPFFTANVTPGLKIAPWPRFEFAVLGITALALLAWVARAQGAWTVALLALAAGLNAWRQWRWAPWKTLTRPILWVLHLAYAWIPAGFALLALAQAGWMPQTAGIHALGLGATGGLIIGMITRTARGHTGRPLRAGPLETAAYVLMMLAALLRVGAPLLAPAALTPGLTLAGGAWSLAFLLYLLQYAPWLLRPRADGKDG
ncbi:NnrS family protein [Ottowia testudinis]|uniref:NnrS family protein n=1 Tax=Ottowia testudinis TaxID=2816950 RepID=A0A975H485_9BURK|nr:NnrS family protein [Ottowia testudinis]QTD46594.1 NnrS family protein [Ottowia testudinis]